VPVKPSSAVKVAALALGLVLEGALSPAEDNRTQYPPYLANSYFGVGFGYIDYPFSERQLEPGFHVESIRVPHAAGRVLLLGHQFNPYLAAQFVYIRPVEWVKYKDVNGVSAERIRQIEAAAFSRLRGLLPAAAV
jgi:hypothetical protein